MELSTKQYFMRMKGSFEMNTLKDAPNPASLITLIIVVLMMAQIIGADTSP